MPVSKKEKQLVRYWKNNWVAFAHQVLKVQLDPEQQRILTAIQNNKKVSIRSGTSRGKDFVTAVAAVCFLYLHTPSKVILTAPTGRQVQKIMIPEVARLYYPELGGRLLNDGIQFERKDHFLVGFKAQNYNKQAWQGFHSPNIFVGVTEAAGIDQAIFDGIEGVLQGNSRLVLAFNPESLQGEAFRSTNSDQYVSFQMNCMEAPNVVNRKNIYPGQVDYEWVHNRVHDPRWATPIEQDQVDETKHDFQWEGQWYRPKNLFRIKVLGEFPSEDQDTLIPYSWIEAANRRWQEANKTTLQKGLRLGVDVAGMGVDNNVMAHRYGNIITQIETLNLLKTETIHMEVAGKIRERLNQARITSQAYAFIDAIGEGAGVVSRLKEQGVENAIAVKGSESAEGLMDISGHREFANLRSYLYFALRDALDPSNGFDLALPPHQGLIEDLLSIGWRTLSTGKIQIESKENIKKKLGRSPDYADTVVNTFYPDDWAESEEIEVVDKDEFGIW